MQGRDELSVGPDELRLIDAGLAQLRKDEAAWQTLVEARGLIGVYDGLKERVRKAIQEPTPTVARRDGCC